MAQSDELGLRYNQGKLQWSLVDFNSLESLVRVLMYGAEKYTKESEISINNILSACNVLTIQIEKLNQEDFVDHVMTRNSNWQIQNIEKDNLLIQLDGIKEILSSQKKENAVEIEYLQTNSEKLVEKKKEKDTYVDIIISPLKNMSLSSYQDVLYADQRIVYMLTMTTNQVNSEQFYVVSATKDLDCLMMIFQKLKKLQIISENIILQNNKIVRLGKNNWMKGLPVTEVCDSLMRHLVAFLNGENKDPESGLEHIGHMMANIMFLSHMMKNKPELDNRLKKDTID